MSRRSRGGKGPPAGPPPLLQRLYGEGNVLCLRELLLQLSRLSREAAALPAGLVQPHDHVDYAQALLERTWCVLRPGAPPLRDGFSLSQASGQHQLLGRAVEALLRTGQNKSGGGGGNVLCYGYRKRRPAAGGRSVPGMTTAEASHHNSTTESLCSPAWQLLLSRIGDTLMLYLLLHTSMFAELPNSCCLQLSGPPIGQVARAWRKDAPAAVAAAASQLLLPRAGASAAAQPAAEAAPGPALTQAPDEPAPSFMGGGLLDGDEAAQDAAAAAVQDAADQAGQLDAAAWPTAAARAEAVCLGGGRSSLPPARQLQQPQQVRVQQQQQQQQRAEGQGKKQARPSSWQRRRAAKLRQQQEQQQREQQQLQQQGRGEEQEASAMQVDSIGGGGEVGVWDLPSTEEVEVEGSSGGGSGGRATPAGSAQALPEAVQPAGGVSAAGQEAVQPAGGGPGGRQEAAAPALAAAAPATAAVAAGGSGGARRGTRAGAQRHGGSCWPARMPRPSDMLLQRSSIFYCASFPRKPGLTSQHMLSKLKGGGQAERSLFASIFDPQHSPVGRAGATFGVAHSVVPPPARRVPARQRHLLPLLQRMVERTAKCPFAILLQHHCPLPPRLRQEQQQRRRQQQQEAAADLVGGADTGAAAAGTAAGGGGQAMAMDHAVGVAARRASGVAAAAAAGPPLPSQGALLQQVREQQQQQQVGSRPLRSGREDQEAGVGRGQPATPLKSVDELLDELFFLEQQQKEEEQQQQLRQRSKGQPGQQPLLREQAVRGAGDAQLPQLEQQQGQGRAPQQRQQGQGAKKARTAQAAAAAAAAAPPAEPAATGGGGSQHSLDPTQPAAGPAQAPAAAAGPAHLGPAPPAAAQPAPLAACFVPHRRVVAFVWAVLRSIVPAPLLGDTRNRRVLRAALGRFVRLRRYEQMSVHQAMQGLRVSGLGWLHPPALHTAGTAEQQQQQRQQQARMAGEGGGPQRQAAGEELHQRQRQQRQGQQQERRQSQQERGAQGRGQALPLLARQHPSPSQHAAQQRQLALWVGWLFCVVVAPLLRAHFYCTESEAYRQQVFYYRKPVWAALARAATEELQERQFTPLPTQEALGILQGRKLGIARLRLLPKRAGMRVILNLGRSSTVRFPGAPQRAGVGAKRQHRTPSVKLTFRPVNSLLQNVYQVLRYEASCQPHLLGASVFGYNDAFCKLLPFVRKWRAAAAAAAAGGGGLQPLLVSVDVTRAFDHVDIPLLLSLVEPLLRHEQYLVLKYSEVVPSLGQVKVLQRRLAAAAQPGDVPAFPLLAQHWAAAHKGKVFTDQVIYDRLSRQQALELLRQHLTANIVRLRRRWCAQSRGIAQGSTLSTLLCSLYLAHLERTQLAPILSAPLPPPSPGAPGRGMATAAAAAAGPLATPGAERVVCLTGGNAAVLSPATVVSLGGRGGAAGASSGSRGLLTELARAADSMATAQPSSEAPGQPPASQRTTQLPACEREGQQQQQQWQGRHGSGSIARRGGRGGSSAGPAGGGSGRQLIGDLLLLPAGAQPSAALVAAGGSSVSIGGAQRTAASLHSPSVLLSPHSSGRAGAASQRQQPGQQHEQQQQLGCCRLAQHAGSVLLRLVDDFLLITAVPAVAQGFAARMLEGFESHNVFVNPDKTKLSFSLQLPPGRSAGSHVGGAGGSAAPAAAGAPTQGHAAGSVVPATVWRSADGSTFVKWCGLLVNTANLELQGDYTRYAGEHLSTSLTLPLRKRPGAQLATRLCQYLRPKIHPLLLDATLNSPQTVRLNIYQAFLVAAMKFHCYVRALTAHPAPCTSVLLDAILSGISFMVSLTRRRRVASAHQQNLQAACATRVPAAHIRWLGLTAFLRVLRRKQTRYARLLAELEELAAAPALRRAVRHLAPVVDPARSSVFDCIQY